MTPTASDKGVFVDDVVKALTRTDGIDAEGADLLRDQMQRAADEFDEHTAQAFGQALLKDLCDAPQDLRKLEALLILGLAHPVVLDENRISLAAEGRRLAVLLEAAGETERARSLLELIAARLPGEEGVDDDLSKIMRKSGSTAELCDRYMQRAEEAVQEGQTAQAISWLQQVLLLDRTRRDIARMIRDLRYQESERKAHVRRRMRLMGFVALLSAFVSGIAIREMRIENQYGELTLTVDGDLESHRTRLAEVEELIAAKGFWIGMFRATGERNGLAQRIELLENQADETRLREYEERTVKAGRAESARLEGLGAVERGDFDAALTAFRRALDVAPREWEPRARIETDVAAIREWRKENE